MEDGRGEAEKRGVGSGLKMEWDENMEKGRKKPMSKNKGEEGEERELFE